MTYLSGVYAPSRARQTQRQAMAGTLRPRPSWRTRTHSSRFYPFVTFLAPTPVAPPTNAKCRRTMPQIPFPCLFSRLQVDRWRQNGLSPTSRRSVAPTLWTIPLCPHVSPVWFEYGRSRHFQGQGRQNPERLSALDHPFPSSSPLILPSLSPHPETRMASHRARPLAPPRPRALACRTFRSPSPLCPPSLFAEPGPAAHARPLYSRRRSAHSSSWRRSSSGSTPYRAAAHSIASRKITIPCCSRT